MTNHDVWDAVVQTDGAPANSFEFLLRIKQGTGSPSAGQFLQTADINNVNPAFTAKNRQRQTYAAKGVESALKYGETLSLTFDIELIRDDNGLYQGVAQDLIDASKSVGLANLREIQAFDALGADYALQSKFGISISRTNTGWDDAGFMTVTATQYGKTTWIDNPVLEGNIPVLLAAEPTGRAATEHVFIQGEHFFLEGVADVVGAASVKFGATNATSYTVISDTLIDAVVPAGAAGAILIHVTNSAGEQTIDYTRGA